MPIVTQPKDATLQFGDQFANINHQGVLTSNIQNTPILGPIFPTTNTGDSLCHAHYTESGTNALQFLNASGSGLGGHKFYTSNSTISPLNTATIDVNGLTVDRSIGGGGNVVYSPNVSELGINGREIFFPLGTDILQPPYSFNQQFNPIYLTQTTALYTTGDLAYAVVASSRSIQIFNNNAITNPIPPNVVPSDFGNSSNVGVTVGIPIFSLSLPSPTVTQITNVGNAISISRNSGYCSLYDNGLFFGDFVNNRQSFMRPYDSEYQDNLNNTATIVGFPSVTNRVFYSRGKTSNIVINVDTPTLTLTDDTLNNNSILSSNDLIFNNVSLKTQVATNTTAISNLSSSVIKQTISSIQGLSLAIFADGRPAIAPTATISQQYAFTPSWYFKNSFSTGVNKINWYFGTPIGLIVSNLLGVYMNLFSASMTSNDSCPFITIYTQPQSGDSTFYHSKRTYLFSQSVTPVINTRYFNFANISGTCPTPQIPAPSNLINMGLSTVSGSNVGPFSPTELILFFSIGSNSAATQNTVEFAINKFGLMTSTGSQEIQLIPI